MPHYPLYDFDLRATHARTLLSAASASVSFGFVLVRVPPLHVGEHVGVLHGPHGGVGHRIKLVKVGGVPVLALEVNVGPLVAHLVAVIGRRKHRDAQLRVRPVVALHNLCMF